MYILHIFSCHKAKTKKEISYHAITFKLNIFSFLEFSGDGEVLLYHFVKYKFKP